MAACCQLPSKDSLDPPISTPDPPGLAGGGGERGGGECACTPRCEMLLFVVDKNNFQWLRHLYNLGFMRITNKKLISENVIKILSMLLAF